VEEGGWASYASPGLGNGMSEASLDGNTPVATRFSLTRTGSGGTARAGGGDKCEDTESESGVTVIGVPGDGGVPR
jgi:hypothetical protein